MTNGNHAQKTRAINKFLYTFILNTIEVSLRLYLKFCTFQISLASLAGGEPLVNRKCCVFCPPVRTDSELGKLVESHLS